MLYLDKKHLIQTFVKKGDTVLDVGFIGENVSNEKDPHWTHGLIKAITSDVYGLDLELPEKFQNNVRYQAADAGAFSFNVKFDVIFAGDLIEHLTNPGLFLDRCKAHLKPGGILIISTPNTFNLFNMVGKLVRPEPVNNHDHTAYHNYKTLSQLLNKCGFDTTEISYMYTLGFTHYESLKKKLLNLVYWLCSKFTYKYIETLVLVAKAK